MLHQDQRDVDDGLEHRLKSPALCHGKNEAVEFGIEPVEFVDIGIVYGPALQRLHFAGQALQFGNLGLADPGRRAGGAVRLQGCAELEDFVDIVGGETLDEGALVAGKGDQGRQPPQRLADRRAAIESARYRL